MIQGRSIRLLQFALTIAACAAAGCQQKMASQPSFRPDQPSALFANGSSSRHPVPGTVARGHLQTDAALFTGRRELVVQAVQVAPAAAAVPVPGQQAPTGAGGTAAGDLQTLLAAEARNYRDLVNEFPYPVTDEMVHEGQDRFMIYCVVCHGAAGTGHGKIVERGYTVPPSYHIDRLRSAPVGHLFRVITDGFGSMPSYAAQIPVRDRWAIVAYIRALQLSQHFAVDKLTPEMRQQMAAKTQSHDSPALAKEITK
jgi:mono/diheme cytochrome c family protein